MKARIKIRRAKSEQETLEEALARKLKIMEVEKSVIKGHLGNRVSKVEELNNRIVMLQKKIYDLEKEKNITPEDKELTQKIMEALTDSSLTPEFSIEVLSGQATVVVKMIIKQANSGKILLTTKTKGVFISKEDPASVYFSVNNSK